MRNIRIIPRLDIKGTNLIKGIQLEGLRVVGSPNKYALKYYEQGADELLFMDVVASLYNRNQLFNIITEVTKNIFIPITVGGGIRSIEDAKKILSCGADKIAINTAAVKNPKIISELSTTFGSQSIVLSIQAKQIEQNKWEVYTDNGRERTGLDVVDWIKKGAGLGAGEILLTSVDKEGTRKGFDIPLIRAVTQEVSLPVIASGGMGKPEDMIDAVLKGEADAIAMADILHYDRATIDDIRNVAISSDIEVRNFEYA